MRRIKPDTILFRVLLAGITIALITGIYMAYAQTDDETPIVLVININGALLFREPDGEWKKAALKEKLYEGYELKTGPVDKAIILYSISGSRVLVNSNTEMVVHSEKVDGKEKGRVNVFIGEVRGKVTKGRQFDVETPSSVASVRGTDFNIDVLENGDSNLLVLEGLVSLRNQFGEVLAERYTRTKATQTSAPTEPEPVKPSEIKKKVKWSEEIETSYEIKLIPGGSAEKSVGDIFNLDIRVLDAKSGVLDNDASLTIQSLSGSPEGLVLSTDGASWSQDIQVSITSGKATVQVRIEEEGDFSINASAADCSPAQITLAASIAKEKKNIDLQYQNEDGDTKSIIIEIEEN